VGRPLRRREDDALLRGRGAFVDGMAPPGTLHLAVVRSPGAHARVGRIRREAALALPGVVAVVGAADLGDLGAMPVRPVEGAELVPSAAVPTLAGEVVRFAGEPVAAVLAESRALAEDAAELVEVDLEPLPVLLDPAESLRSDLLLHPAAPGNVLLRWRRSGGDPAGRFARAAHVVAAHLRIPRLVACPIEPRGCLAVPAPDREGLTLWCPAQGPHQPLEHLAAILRRHPERLRVIMPDVGGAFGSKTPLAPEQAVAAVLALRWGRPVKWIEDRSENFVGAYQGRGVEADVELAVDRDGRFTAIRARLVADLGAYLYPATGTIPITTAMLLTGAYDIPAADVEVTGVATNKVPTGPYRGAGRPEAAFVVERMVDLAAAELGIDPVELRRRNVLQADRFPHRTPLGYTYDSGDYPGALDRACELLGRRPRGARRPAGRVGEPLVGVGLALFVAQAAPVPWEAASAALGPDGRIVVRTGASPQGQGHATAFAQIAADGLGVAPEDVEVEHGDSAAVPAGVGTFGSRSVTAAGSAVLAALERLRARLVAAAAEALEVAEDDLRWEGGRFAVAGAPQRSIGLAELAAAGRDPLEAEATFRLPGLVFPFGAYGAVVEVDPETGAVRLVRLVAVNDAGTVVNPLLAEGQVHGSILQGLAAVLSEEAVYDRQGQLLTGSMTTYGIPSAADLAAELRHEFRHTPSPSNPLGAKGLGESGTIGAPAAVANAVADALASVGVRGLDPPFSPERVWRAIRAAGHAGS
jgi:aerobic carbon-monoxide dehydrogenase large subunit